MPNPVLNSVHVDRPLLDLAIANFQEKTEFVTAGRVPMVTVEKQSDKYFVFDKADLNRLESAQRAAGTEAVMGGYKISTDSYFANRYSIAHPIPSEEFVNADTPLDPFADAMDYLNQQNCMRSEKLWADTLFKAGIWGIDLAGVPGAPGAGQFKQWDQAGSTPIVDIRLQKAAVKLQGSRTPNKLILGEQAFNILIDHPDVVARYSANGQGAGSRTPINEQMLAEMLGLQEVVVGGAVINTAAEGAVEANQYILGKHALLAYCNPTSNPRVKQPSAFYSFAWRAARIGGDENGMRIRQYPDERTDSTVVEADLFMDHKLTGVDMAAFFSAVIA